LAGGPGRTFISPLLRPGRHLPTQGRTRVRLIDVIKLKGVLRLVRLVGLVVVVAALGAGACVDLTPPSVTVATDGPGADQRSRDLPPVDAGDGFQPVDAPPLGLGKRCATGEQCASGICRHGYCCDKDCSGACQACDLAGSEGSCLPVPAGQDPREDCTEDPVSSCAGDGTCDGQGGCRRYPMGTECAAGRCSEATEYAASTCDANGVCQPGSSRSCAPNVCMGGSCSASCGGQADCQNGFVCEGGRCMVRRSEGALCDSGGQCASGHCIDGVCCRTPCAGTCERCNLPGNPGTCTAIAAGQDLDNECPAEPASSCGRLGGCNGNGACRLHPPGVICRAGSCSGSVETAISRCDGSGVCLVGGARDCTPYLCSGAACGSSCSSNANCKGGHFCAGSTCLPFGAAPALHWKLDDTSGTTAADSSGNGFAGTYTGQSGTPSSSTNVPGVYFSNPASRAFVAGSRHAVRLSPAPPALRPSNNLTISLWYRTTTLDLGHDPPAASEAISLGNNYFVRIRAADIAWTRRSATGYISCFAVVSNHLDGRWHHVGAVVSPAGMKVYIDGVERCSNTRGENLAFDMGSELWVARHGTGEIEWDFDGNLDDVRIYTRALPADEIAALASGY
jgi:Concanavalin A-like lectin/glucanases superfamily